jgi:phosphonate transport system permease protein
MHSPQGDAFTTFERAQRELRRSRRWHHIAWCVLFVLALAFSCYAGEVRVHQFLEGLPGFFNYLRDITPEIQAHRALHDIKKWYWGIGTWLQLLFDTVVMAFLGTLFGACGAFLVCFPASRNLVRNTALVVLACSLRIASG